MSWNLTEALEYYRRQGAPGSQPSLVNLLREVQLERGGSLPMEDVTAICTAYGLKETFLLAVIKRIPSLRLAHTHCLEICAGEGCRQRGRLASFVEKTYGPHPRGFTVKYVNCLRMCGQGPVIRWDGVLYPAADERLIRTLVEQISPDR